MEMQMHACIMYLETIDLVVYNRRRPSKLLYFNHGLPTIK
jgi:hypothetical protein